MADYKVFRDAYGALTPVASPAGSEGLEVATLVSRRDGSSHVEISVCRLQPGGHVEGHLHPFEESFYILSGEVLVGLDHEWFTLVQDDFGFAPVAAPHAWSNPFDTAVTWYRIRSPQPRKVGEHSGTYPIPDYERPTEGSRVEELHPRSRFLGHFSASDMPPPGPLTMPGTHAHHIRDVSVRMMVDDVLGAIHHQFFMVQFQPPEGDYFSGSPHYHDFEEAYFVVEGRGEVQLEDERFDVGEGDLVWEASGTMHAWRAIGGRPLRFIELMAPRPPYMNLLFSEATWSRWPR